MTLKNNTAVIKKLVYPVLEKFLSSPTGKKEFIKMVGDFINKRSDALFSPMPLDRIAYTYSDKAELFEKMHIPEGDVKNAIANTYYADIKKHNFAAAQDPCTIVAMCLVRFFFLKNDKKNLDLATTYLAFSGKFYPSIHYKYFHIPPADYVMEYVVNNSINNRFEIAKQGNVFNMIRSRCQIWIDAYKKRFTEFEDDDIVYLILQLRTRMSNQMQVIAREYYKAYENKDYIVYNSDNVDTDNPNEYHIAKSDSFEAEKIIDRAMNLVAASGASYKIARLCANKSVKTDDLRAIVESIYNDKNNYPDIRDIMSTMVYSWFAYSKSTNILTMDFIVFATSLKPNTKDKNWIRAKQHIERWLDTGSASYRKRKGRPATRNDYQKALNMYIAMTIYTANK